MSLADLMNARVDVYRKKSSGAAVEDRDRIKVDVLCRIRSVGARDSIQEGDGFTPNVTDIANIEYTSRDSDREWLVAGNVLKVTSERDPASNAWEAVTNGDEFQIVGRPQDASGQHHHWRVQLSYLPPGTI